MKCCRETPVKTDASVGGGNEVGDHCVGQASGAGEAVELSGVRSIPDGGARAKVILEDPQLAVCGQVPGQVIFEEPTCRYLC